MKAFLPIAVAALLFTSCSTAYKSGQTPDDVYFSPQRPQDEYVRVEKNNDRRYQYNDDEDSYDDNYLRMKVRNRDRWAMLDNDFYFYNSSPYAYYNPYLYSNPYSYGFYGSPFNNYGLYNGFGLGYGGFGYGGFGLGLYNNYYGMYNTPYFSHYGSYYYNPYGAPLMIVGNSKTPVYNRPRTSNLNIYNNNRSYGNNNNNPRPRISVGNNRNYGSYGDYNSFGRNTGSDMRSTFGNNSSNNNGSYNNSSSRPSSSSSSGSSSSGGGGGNAPVRRF